MRADWVVWHLQIVLLQIVELHESAKGICPGVVVAGERAELAARAPKGEELEKPQPVEQEK